MKTEHNAEKSRFDLYDDTGAHVGKIVYEKGEGNRLCATYTEVFPGNEGKAYGTKLVDALAHYAEENGFKIVPVCPFVKALFNKKPEKYANIMQ